MCAQRGEGEPALVVDLPARVCGSGMDHRTRLIIRLFRQAFGSFPNGVLRRFQQAIKAAKDGERQDDLVMLRLLEVAAQEVRNGPDERGIGVDGILGHGGLSGSCGRPAMIMNISLD